MGEYVSWSAKAGSVQRDILRAAAGASMVLADISGEGSNVYIETGAELIGRAVRVTYPYRRFLQT